MTEITTSSDHGFLPGDAILILISDRRWWRRFLYWITCRGEPVIETIHTIITSADVNTLTITEER